MEETESTQDENRKIDNMKILLNNKKTNLLFGLAAGLCALLNFSALGAVYVLDTAFNPTTGHTYYLLDNSNWSDAENAAIGLGGHLTTINDLAENNWVWNRWGTGHDLWIGLHDPIVGDGSGPQHAANFVWADGSPSPYRNWRPGEPNNSNGDYFTYILANGLDGGGQWNDVMDTANTPNQPLLHGVVEVVPEPTSAALIAVGLIAGFFAKRGRSGRA